MAVGLEKEKCVANGVFNQFPVMVVSYQDLSGGRGSREVSLGSARRRFRG